MKSCQSKHMGFWPRVPGGEDASLAGSSTPRASTVLLEGLCCHAYIQLQLEHRHPLKNQCFISDASLFDFQLSFTS